MAACYKQGGGRPRPPQPAEVSVLTVKAQTVPVVFEFVGQTESSQQVEIRARVNGFLEKRVYTEGSFVKPGQVLFLMDAKPFDADLKAAKGELAQQQARLTTAAPTWRGSSPWWPTTPWPPRTWTTPPARNRPPPRRWRPPAPR